MATLKLPDKTRKLLGELHKARVQAEKEFQMVAGATFDVLGLDTNQTHQINFDTGIITPAEPNDTAPAAEVLN